MCYLANKPEGVIRELIGPSFMSAGSIIPGLLKDRVVSVLELPGSFKAAKLTDNRCLTFGINNELSTSAPYKVSQQWAQHFFMHGYGGIWYRPRFSAGENPGHLPYLILLGNMMAEPIQIHAESTPLCERWGL